MIEIRTKIPENVAKIITELVDKGYFSSMANFARQAIIDKIVESYEIGLAELEPEMIKQSKKGS